MSASFDVGTRNSVPVKPSDEVSVNCKNTSACGENHGLVTVFEEAAFDHKVDVSHDTNIAICGPVKMFDNQTCGDNRTLSSKQTTVEPTSCAVQQSTGSNETDYTVTADSRLMQNSEIQNAVIQLASELAPDELHNVYNRVFYRR